MPASNVTPDGGSEATGSKEIVARDGSGQRLASNRFLGAPLPRVGCPKLPRMLEPEVNTLAVQSMVSFTVKVGAQTGHVPTAK